MTGRETAPLHLDHPSTLSRTLDATLHLGEQVELAVLLRLVIDEARSLCGARFGAIWVLDERRTMLSEFVCSGRRSGGGGEAIGRGGPPDGRPPATLAADPVLVRLVQLDLDDRSRRIGFRPAHPEATSFLRFPIKVHGLSSGCLYLTEKERSTEFTDDDETLVAVLAMAAGIASKMRAIRGLSCGSSRTSRDDTVPQRASRSRQRFAGLCPLSTRSPKHSESSWSSASWI
jgi:transcriptional regulator with GAF, ATPase, and Fis domain